jgi:Ca2+-binding EF-hand superfamily protein
MGNLLAKVKKNKNSMADTKTAQDLANEAIPEGHRRMNKSLFLEFCEAVNKVRADDEKFDPSKCWTSNVRALTEEMDTNGDGSVDKKELVAWLQSDKCKWTKEDFEAIKKVLADTNASGSSWQETKGGMIKVDKDGRLVSERWYGSYTPDLGEADDSPYGCY